MDIIFVPILQVLRVILELYSLGLFIFGLLMLLESFNVIDSYNKVTYKIHNTLFLIYNPALEKIRSVINFEPFDASVLILWLLIYFLKQVLIRVVTIF
ncbi:MAG: YggT family protein [Alphaproteobacteria bacterium]|nr:MAG: YggT family protein [Alphaproteobacteria bacterium]